MNEPYRDCPRFEHCSVNACPLDYAMLGRGPLSGEDRCGARRNTRLAVAAEHPGLPAGGLTLAEVARDKRSAAAKARWAALPQAERDAATARLTQRRADLSGVLAGASPSECPSTGDVA